MSRHMIIMPTDCYKATSGRYAGAVVRKSSMGVEIPATFDETRLIASDFTEEAIEQAFKFHTCDCVTTVNDSTLAVSVSWTPKSSAAYKIEEYA